MNFRVILYMVGYALRAEGAMMLFPAAVGLIFGEGTAAMWYAVFAAVALLLARIFTTAFKNQKSVQIKPKEAIVTVPIVWLVLSAVGCMPFVMTGDIPSFTDAMFEMVSGFTTTGSTITTNVELLTHATNFWRCESHWIGGMGILVFILTVMPLTGGSAMNVMKAESPGPEVTKIVPRLKDTSQILYVIYAIITVIEGAVLMFEGMNLYEARTTAMGTAGTGGFGIYADSMGGFSPLIQWTVGFFMMVFGVNFNSYVVLRNKIRGKSASGFFSEEVRWYLGIITVASLTIALNINKMFGTFFEALRHAYFTVCTVMTTTGFATVDFDLWPEYAKTLLLTLMFVGACAGSTGGGMKVSRVVMMLKSVKEELSRMVHPRAVRKIRFEGKAVDYSILHGIYLYFLAYVAVFVVSLIIVTFDNYDFTTNFSAIAATINNIGPGFNAVGASCNFSGYSHLSKWVMTFDMLAGRLEIMPCLVLLYPGTWKKKS